MAAVAEHAEEELLDYEEEEVAAGEEGAAKGGDQAKKGYVGIHSTGFKDFLLKPELLRAIQNCGFEHPSEGASVCVCARGASVRVLPACAPVSTRRAPARPPRTPRPQCSTSASRRPSWAWTCSARPSRAWARPPSS